MKHITHHAQDATALDLRAAQPATCPDHHIAGQRTQQHQQVLRLKTLLIALGETQPLLVAPEGGFDAFPVQIVEGNIRRQDGNGISGLRARALQHREYLLSRQRADQHAVGEGTVLSATAHGNALDGHSRLGVR